MKSKKTLSLIITVLLTSRVARYPIPSYTDFQINSVSKPLLMAHH